MTVIRGTYNAVYNSLSIGNTQVGFRKNYSYRGRPINFDAVGETPVDTLFAGLELSVDFVAQEFDASAIDILRWPFHATIGQLDPAGQSLWELAKPLLLISCHTDIDPQTILFPKAILAPEYQVSIEYSHRERPLPMRLQVFPVMYDSEGYATPSMPSGCEDIVYFVETNWP